MKKILMVCLFLSIVSFLSGYENNMPNITTPSILAPGQIEFEIIHRFRDDIPDIPKYGIFTSGANVRLGLRGCVWDKLDLYTTYENLPQEIQVGANYSVIPEGFFIKGVADVTFFTFQQSFNAPWNQSLFGQLEFQTIRLLKIFAFNADFAYDLYNQSFGGAIGLDAKILQNFNLYVEYGQSLLKNSLNTNVLPNGYISFGAKIETMGHHFIFVVQNSDDIGMRRLLMGTASYTNWYFGFTIQRLFDLVPDQTAAQN